MRIGNLEIPKSEEDLRKLWIHIVGNNSRYRSIFSKECIDLDDFIQLCFIKLINIYASFDPSRSTLNTFLGNIPHWAYRELRAKHSSRSRTGTTVSYDAGGVEVEDRVEDVFNRVDALYIMQSIAKINPKYRTILEEFYVRSKSASKIAKEMQISRITVYAHLNRGIHQLRILLGKKESRT